MSYTISATPHPATSTAHDPPLAGRAIPVVWRDVFREAFVASSLMTAIARSEELPPERTGDTVKVPLDPDVDVYPYEATQATPFSRPGGLVATIDIKNGFAFSVIIDHVLLRQGLPALVAAIRRTAMRKINLQFDALYIPQALAAVPAANKGANAGVVTMNVGLGTSGSPLALANVRSALAAAGSVLDQQEVSGRGRWAVVSFAVAAQIRSIMSRDETPPPEAHPRLVARMVDLDVYVSAAVPANRMLVGHFEALEHVYGVVTPSGGGEVDHYATFASILRGLVIAGLVPSKPTGLAEVYIA